MRTLIDIPPNQIRLLEALTKATQLSRSEIIRRAISAYIEKNAVVTPEVFGLWRDQAEEGLAYQKRVRSEW